MRNRAGSTPEPSAERRSRGPALATFVGGLLLLALAAGGIGATIAIPSFNRAADQARTKACLANQRFMWGAEQTYQAKNGKPPVTLNDLIADGEIKKMPLCPSHGYYEWNPRTGRFKCTVHGEAPGQN
jgi:competence protein ComGC